jgi:hypothetical protein
MEGRWTIRWQPFTASSPGGYKVGGNEPWPTDDPTPVVPCNDTAVDAAVQWAMSAGVKPMREFVEGIVAAMADAPLGCPCVGTPDEADCPHA